MINLFRFGMIVLVVCFSSIFLASLVYSIRCLMQGGSFSLIIPLFLNSLYWSSGFVLSITLLAASPFGDAIAKLFFPLRKASMREEVIINPAMDRVISAYKNKYGEYLKYKILVMDVPNINGMALGRQTIGVSTGLLKVASEDELVAMLAHEVGHLHHKDGLFHLALRASSLPTIYLNFLLSRFLPNPESEGEGMGIAFGIILFVLFFLFFCYFGVLWIVSIPMLWLMVSVEFLTQWPIEYRADKFAHKIGFGASLIELFERTEDEDIRHETGFLSKYIYSHPPTALRIDRIERDMI